MAKRKLQQSTELLHQHDGKRKHSAPEAQTNPALSSLSNVCLNNEDGHIEMVHNLIDRCLSLSMTRDEVFNELFNCLNIGPCYVNAVWQRLVEENPEFFRAYNARLIQTWYNLTKFSEDHSATQLSLHGGFAHLPVPSSNEISAEQPFPSMGATQGESSCPKSSIPMFNGVSAVDNSHLIEQNVGVASDNHETATVFNAHPLVRPDEISRMSVQPMALSASLLSNMCCTKVFQPELNDESRSFSNNLSSPLHSSKLNSAEQPFPSTGATQVESSCLGYGVSAMNNFHLIERNVGVASDNQETATISNDQFLRSPDGILRMSAQPLPLPATFLSNMGCTEVFQPEYCDISNNINSPLYSSNVNSAEQPFPFTGATLVESSCHGYGVSAADNIHVIQRNIDVASDNQETATISNDLFLRRPDGILRTSVQSLPLPATLLSNMGCIEVFQPEYYDGSKSFSNNISSPSLSVNGNSVEQLLLSMATIGATNMESSYPGFSDNTVIGIPEAWNHYPTQRM